MSRINIQGRDDLVRDARNGAVLNTNLDDLTAYKSKMKHEELTEKRIDNLAEETHQIKSDLEEIKGLLVNLIQSKDNN